MKVRRLARGAGVALAAISALALSGCTSSAPPSAHGAPGSPYFTVVRSNVTHGNLNLFLSDLSCASLHDCWATGEDTVPSGEEIPPNGTLLMHFDGSAWRQVLHTGDVQSSNPPQLGQVSCPTDGWCMAIVGFSGHTVGVPYPTFAIITNDQLHLLGTKAVGAFSAIDCLSSTDCVGVGLMSGGKFSAAKWNGTVWTAMPTKGVHGQASAASCPTVTYCLAVGSNFGVGVTPGPGAMQWNGSVWRSTSNPVGKFGTAPPCQRECPERVSITPSFTAVSCTAPSHCVALGSGYGSFGFSWNGTAWTEMPALFDAGIEGPQKK